MVRVVITNGPKNKQVLAGNVFFGQRSLLFEHETSLLFEQETSLLLEQEGSLLFEQERSPAEKKTVSAVKCLFLGPSIITTRTVDNYDLAPGPSLITTSVISEGHGNYEPHGN